MLSSVAVSGTAWPFDKATNMVALRMTGDSAGVLQDCRTRRPGRSGHPGEPWRSNCTSGKAR